MTTNPESTSTLAGGVALADAPPAAAPTAGGDDPRMVFAKAVALGTAVIGRVGTHQLANPTPCPDLDVRGLLGHLVTVLRRVAALGRGDDPFGPAVFAGVDGDRWQQAWLDAAHDVQAAWADDASLVRTVRLPWLVDAGAVALAVYVNEVSVHTWDLATATGQRPAWDPEVLGVALDAIRFMPADGRSAIFEQVRANMPPGRGDFADPFADAVVVPADAPLIDRLVAWNGRRPC